MQAKENLYLMPNAIMTSITTDGLNKNFIAANQPCPTITLCSPRQLQADSPVRSPHAKTICHYTLAGLLFCRHVPEICIVGSAVIATVIPKHRVQRQRIEEGRMRTVRAKRTRIGD